MPNYIVQDFRDIQSVECPCGFAKRAFVSPENSAATMHITQISRDSRTHYHKKLTELYMVLEGSGKMELDGDSVPVRQFTAVLIKPGCRHRAVGNLKVLIVAIPPFDTDDEHFD